MEVKIQFDDEWVYLEGCHKGAKDYISSLPEELIQQIFSHLSLEDRCRSRSVSRRWNISLLRESAYQEISKIKGLIEFLNSSLKENDNENDVINEDNIFNCLKSKIQENFGSFKELKEHSLLIQRLILKNIDGIDLLIKFIEYFNINKLLFDEIVKDVNFVYNDINDFFKDIYGRIYTIADDEDNDDDVDRKKNITINFYRMCEGLKKNNLDNIAENFKIDYFNCDFIIKSETYEFAFHKAMNDQRVDDALEALRLISPFNPKKDEFKKQLVYKFLVKKEKEKAKELAFTITDEVERTDALNLVKNWTPFSPKESCNIS